MREPKTPESNKSVNNAPGTVTAGIDPLLLSALGHVARYGNGAARRPSGLSLDEGEGHCDVESASGLVCRVGQSRAALQFHDTVCHGGFEAAPMGRPQVCGDDQVELLTERLRGAVAGQGGGMVPPHDRSCSVCEDNGIGDLFEDRFSQRRCVFHKLTPPFRIDQFASAATRPGRDGTDRQPRELSLTASVEYCSAG